MLRKEQIIQLFEELNSELIQKSETAEVGIVGGAVMCLVFNARASTRDVDGVFKPTSLVRKLVAKIAENHNLPTDWLNDAAKGFIVGHFQKQEVLNLSNLRVWAPDAKYMLAMKCISARWDSHDKDDVIFLIRYLKLKKPNQVFKLIEDYYPKKQIPAKTQFLIEEVMETN